MEINGNKEHRSTILNGRMSKEYSNISNYMPVLLPSDVKVSFCAYFKFKRWLHTYILFSSIDQPC